MTTRRIGLIGEFGSGNFGNDASFEAVLEFLRAERPHAEIVAICDKPAVVHAKFGVQAMRLTLNPPRLLDRGTFGLARRVLNWALSLLNAGNLDVLVFPGTGVLDDYLAQASGYPSQIMRWCSAVRRRGGRVAFLDIGAGPIVGDKSRRVLTQGAALAQHRSYRDEASRAFMEDLGLDESQSAVLPDITYRLPAPRARAISAGPTLTVGLGTMAYAGWVKDAEIAADYQDKLARFVLWLEGQGHRVKLLIGKPSDMRCLNAVQAQAGGDTAARLPAGPMESMHDVMRETADTDIVVASRFHILVAALKTGRPAISLSYAPKNDALLQAAGLGAFCQPAERFDFDRLTAHFTELAAERAHYHALVSKHTTRACAELDKKLRSILPDVLGEAPTPEAQRMAAE